jgi:hypothetical protein
MPEEQEPYGLMFAAPRTAAELEREQIVVLDGHVLDVRPDPDDPERVRIRLITALGPPPGRSPDRREFELVCPRDMVFGTAQPHNIELAPLPPPA